MTSNTDLQQASEQASRASKPEKITWVGCDACGKWRKVSQSFAESLDEDKSWYCELNPDPAYNTCDAPQELSDQEIDLNLASTNGHEGTVHKQQRPAVWQHVTENIFTHRSRKLENEDDIMVCQCKAPRDGGPGCGESCLNRMLNQECNPDFCPCGSQCSNTQFTQRQYADLDQRRAGPKGFGLFTKQDLKAGQFVIEYVGEVLEEEEYLRRKIFYQEVGQRHYYFMNIGNGEVIDACRKGALGRFINHSCDPNCETQKWVVHGELAIGLFALKDVQAGQELTFDYNFERYGDKALKCYCQSESCRGYIGGLSEEQSSDVEVDDFADASNDPEPIMVGSEDVSKNPACQAILANEVGLAAADFQDDKLRRGWEVLAAKYSIALDWEAVSKDVVLSAESAEGSKATNGETQVSAAAFEAVEQKLKTKAQRRQHTLSSAKPEPKTSKRPGLAPGNVSSAANWQDGSAHSSTSNQAARQSKWSAPSLKGFRRRSEVDRRLDNLVGNSGKLRESGLSSIIKMLRLFNLCDLGSSTATAGDPLLAKADLAAANSRTAAGESARKAAADEGINLHGDSRRKRLKLDTDSLEESSPERDREDGEIGDRALESRSWSPKKGQRDSRGRDAGSKETVGLTPRQRARMADLSLLLEVILKTTATSTKQEFCKCGILRQLQSVMARCTGPTYTVIIKKMLRAVEHLPLNPDQLHQHSSAHGSFFDTLFASGMYTDYEIRSRARALKERYPLEACSPEVQETARAARAAAQAGNLQHSHRRRPKWKADQPQLSPLHAPMYQRFSRQSSTPARPRVSKFHGPAERPVWESPASSDSRQWKARDRSDRESLWSDRTPADARLLDSSLHQQRNGSPAQPHAWPSQSSMQQASTAAPAWKENPRSETLHRLRMNSTAVNSNPPRLGQMNSYPVLGNSPQSSLGPARRTAWDAKPTSPSGSRQQGTSRPTGFSFQASHKADISRQYSAPTISRGWSDRPPEAHDRVFGHNDFQGPAQLASPPPPLPNEPPPRTSPILSSVSPGGSPVSAGLPSVSPVTPNGASLLDPPSPPILTGAYMDEDDQLRSQSQPEDAKAPQQIATKAASDWKVPAWSMDPHSAQQTKLAALAAPLPAPGGAASTRSLQLKVDATDRLLPSRPGVDNDNPDQTDEDPGSGGSPRESVSSWDRPSADFDAFVGRVIARRLSKYQQPDHPNHISQEEFKELYKKSRRAIIDAERKAYEERQRNRSFKFIEREKLESRIRDYVRDLIRRLHDKKLTAQSNGVVI